MALQILVLGFCDTQRDLEVVQKILSQVHKPLHHHLHAIPGQLKCLLHLCHAKLTCQKRGHVRYDAPSMRLSMIQACHAYASEGGRIIVVMTQRDKIGMEALFRRVLPPHKRLGSQFVFRQARAANILAHHVLLNWPTSFCWHHVIRHVKCL